MQGIKVELTVVPSFRQAVETKTGIYHLFNRLLDGLGAGVPEVVSGQDKIEFENVATGRKRPSSLSGY
ncbi:MAG: hypothetical protein LRZ85_09830 [Alphaproteobacteria bacterium]|nr:hypothetical protein [Alphaproteobacteria bacterium]